jgi:phage regulator Rha-like protein
MDAVIERLDEMEEDLAARAFLFDHPDTYREAIRMAFGQMRARLRVEPKERAAIG